MSLHSPWIIQDARPKIMNAHLTFISRMTRFLFTYTDGQYSYYGRMWQYSSLIAECARLEVVDEALMLTLSTEIQSLYTQSLSTHNGMVIIDSQWIISRNSHLHPKASCPLTIGWTTSHGMWAMDDPKAPTLPHFPLAIYRMLIHPLLFAQYPLTTSPFLIKLLLLNFHELP